jgi:hypothetical protein
VRAAFPSYHIRSLLYLCTHLSTLGHLFLFNPPQEELWSLYTVMNGTLERSVFSSAPAVDAIETAVATVMAGLPARVTRLHFHTLGAWRFYPVSWWFAEGSLLV